MEIKPSFASALVEYSLLWAQVIVDFGKSRALWPEVCPPGFMVVGKCLGGLKDGWGVLNWSSLIVGIASASFGDY